MPDNILEVGSLTIHIGIDTDGSDVIEVEMSEEVSVLHALGALQVAQRDLLNSVNTDNE